MAHLYYPKASLEISGVDGGSMVGGPPRGVVHTTETGPIYRGNTYYHIQIDHTSTGGIEIVQFIPLERASRALRNLSGGVQTNRQGDYCLNVAVADYARNASVLSAATAHDTPCIAWEAPSTLTTMSWPTAIYEALDELMGWAGDEMGIPYVFPELFDGPAAYGYEGSVRISASEWLDLSGWVGHQHVPENDHWDPGRLKTELLQGEGDDDMPDPRISDEEAETLRQLHSAIEAKDSNGYSIGAMIDLVRDLRGGVVKTVKEMHYAIEKRGSNGFSVGQMIDHVRRARPSGGDSEKTP